MTSTSSAQESRRVAAVFEGGVLRPLEPLELAEHQQVEITVSVPVRRQPTEMLAAWRSVYEGLSREEVELVERIALDRSRFSSAQPPD